MKKKLLAILISSMGLLSMQAFAETYQIKSPDGTIEAKVSDGDKLKLTVLVDGKVVLDSAEISMDTSKGKLGVGATAIGSSATSVDTKSTPVWGIRKTVPEVYNQLVLDFKNNYKLTLRAYNDAVAYRFSTSFGGGELLVNDETLLLPLDSSDKIIAHAVTSDMDSFEHEFLRMKVSEAAKHHSITLPLIYEKDGMKVAVVESDLWNYPGLRFKHGKKGGLDSYFVKYPKSFKENRHIMTIGESENFIAKTSGTRDFPWRAFIPARRDSDLAVNDLVYRLARPSEISDTSWIEPGICVWEWWNCWNLEGVDFKAGINEETYRYYIDYAAEHGIPYLLFDAGWLSGFDVAHMVGTDEVLLKEKPCIDVPGLIKYAHSKDVKVILWMLGKSMNKYPVQSFDILKKWGADGLKIDFIDRDDQLAVEFYEKMAKLAAERKMLVDFHGCMKPAGLCRAYPNVVNFEGVKGAEFNKFKEGGLTPTHNVDLVFTRMLQGPMDYTPGVMRNCRDNEFYVCNNQPMAKGTRAHQVAMYIAYYAPLQMMCDSPTEYLKYPELLEFIATTPTTWDDSKAIEGKIGEYVLLVRRNGDTYYIAGMNGGDAREVEIDFSKILPEDTVAKAEIVRDTVNSDKLPRDYKQEVIDVNSESKLKLKMEKGGGFAIKLTPCVIDIFGVGLF